MRPAGLRYGKTGNKILQLVLKHCYKMSWVAIFRVLPSIITLSTDEEEDYSDQDAESSTSIDRFDLLREAGNRLYPDVAAVNGDKTSRVSGEVQLQRQSIRPK